MNADARLQRFRIRCSHEGTKSRRLGSPDCFRVFASSWRPNGYSVVERGLKPSRSAAQKKPPGPPPDDDKPKAPETPPDEPRPQPVRDPSDEEPEKGPYTVH